jgi:hypothetical protein
MAAGQRPRAEVDAQLDDARVVVAVGRNGHRQLDPALVAVDGQHRLFDSAPGRDDAVDIVDSGVARGQPSVGLGHEPLGGAAALDAATHRVMELRLARERPDERVGLTGHQPSEVRHRPSGSGLDGLTANALHHGGREQLRDPWHT